MNVVNLGNLARPVSEPIRGTKLRRLVEDYWYHDPDTGHMLMVPRGFVWNGTSIPWLFRPMLGGAWNPKFEIAGLIHDFLYRKYVWDQIPRQQADRIFRDILILEDNPTFRAWEMYYGVRSGGWASFNKKPLDWKMYDNVT